MADILTLAQARAALGWAEGKNPDRNAELEAVYIPATTETVEAWCGRMDDRTETWVTDAASPITTPWPAATIKAVYAGDVKLSTYSFAAGVLTVPDPSYAVGDRVKVVAGGLPVPRAVVLAAQIILAQIWNAAHQGQASGSVRGEPDSIPSTFVMPRRAEALLNPYWHFGGFR